VLEEEEEAAMVLVGKDKNDDGDDGREVGKADVAGEVEEVVHVVELLLLKLCCVSFCLSKVRPGEVAYDSCVWGVLGGAQKLVVASS
jgi:hypothetical protein